jgi:hypothetical protein
MQQIARHDRLDQFLFQRRGRRRGLAQGPIQGAHAQAQPQPVVQKLPHPPPRQAKAQMQRDDQGGQPRSDQTPLTQGHRLQGGVLDHAFAGMRTRAVTTATGGLIVAMVGHLQA